MQEYSSSITDYFNNGLRAYDKGPRNHPQCVEAYNVKVGPRGVEPYEVVSCPFELPGVPLSTPITLSWPFPQVFKTVEEGLIVGTASNLYDCNGAYLLSSILSGLSGTDIWSLADFGDYQVWTNGTDVVERNATTGLYSIVTPGWTVNSVCNFRGQLVGGGFDSDQSLVAWSPIGNVTLANLLSTTYNYDQRKNTGGFRKIPFFGDIVCVKPIGKIDAWGRDPGAVIVYCKEGVIGLFAVSDPAPTFGMKVLHEVGIPCRGAVGGDEHQHVFIDRKGWLYTLGENFKLEKSGYQEFFEPMLSNKIMISLDTSNREYYISDGTTTYLLSNKLTEVYQLITSLVTWGGSLLGVTGNSGLGTHSLLVTDTLDFGSRSIKTVTGLELGLSKVSGVTAAIDYLYEGSTFRTSVAKSVNKSGGVVPIVAGIDLRFRIRAASLTDFSLTSAHVRFKRGDKRNVRGLYATNAQATAGAGVSEVGNYKVVS